MNDLIAMLTDMLGPLGPMIALGGLGLLLVLATLPFLLTKKPDPLDKLRRENTRHIKPDEAPLRIAGKSRMR
ncbi:hypothetical protein LCGC14_1844090 [marine sediment metagenome]|uniref:Uncharacterized protein n=1 Tax=marine sediment metagenome TaxID=412755 RepID=A0A0F9GCJ8_9ZZZZ